MRLSRALHCENNVSRVPLIDSSDQTINTDNEPNIPIWRLEGPSMLSIEAEVEGRKVQLLALFGHLS